jgi:hypothetical protein
MEDIALSPKRVPIDDDDEDDNNDIGDVGSESEPLVYEAQECTTDCKGTPSEHHINDIDVTINVNKEIKIIESPPSGVEDEVITKKRLDFVVEGEDGQTEDDISTLSITKVDHVEESLELNAYTSWLDFFYSPATGESMRRLPWFSDSTSSHNTSLMIGITTMIVILSLLGLFIGRKRIPRRVRKTANASQHGLAMGVPPITVEDLVHQIQHQVDNFNDSLTYNVYIDHILKCRASVDEMVDLISNDAWVNEVVSSQQNLDKLRSKVNILKKQINHEESLLRNRKLDIEEERYVNDVIFELAKLNLSIEKFEREEKVAETLDIFLIDKQVRELEIMLRAASDQEDAHPTAFLESLLCACELLEKFTSKPDSVHDLIIQAKEITTSYFNKEREDIENRFRESVDRQMAFCQQMQQMQSNILGITNGNGTANPMRRIEGSDGADSNSNSIIEKSSNGMIMHSNQSNALEVAHFSTNLMLLSVNSSIQTFESSKRTELRELKKRNDKVCTKASHRATDIFQYHERKKSDVRGHRDELAAQSSTKLHDLEDKHAGRLREIEKKISFKRSQLAGGQYLVFAIVAAWIAILYFMKTAGFSVSLATNPITDLKICFWKTIDLICSNFEFKGDSGVSDPSLSSKVGETSIPFDLFSSKASSSFKTTGYTGFFSIANMWSSLSVMNTNEMLLNKVLGTLTGIFPTVDPVTLQRYSCLLSMVGRIIPGIAVALFLSGTGMTWLGLPSFLSGIVTLFCFSDVIFNLWTNIMRPLVILQALHWGIYLVLCFVDKISWSLHRIALCCVFYVCIMIFLVYQVDDIVSHFQL